MTEPPRPLDNIEHDAAAATAGRWTKDAHYVVGMSPGCRPGGEVIITCTPTIGGYPAYTQAMREANATFIAAARTDVPALVARVRELEKERDDAWYLLIDCGHNVRPDAPVVEWVKGLLAAMTDLSKSSIGYAKASRERDAALAALDRVRAIADNAIGRHAVGKATPEVAALGREILRALDGDT